MTEQIETEIPPVHIEQRHKLDMCCNMKMTVISKLYNWYYGFKHIVTCKTKQEYFHEIMSILSENEK